MRNCWQEIKNDVIRLVARWSRNKGRTERREPLVQRTPFGPRAPLVCMGSFAALRMASGSGSMTPPWGNDLSRALALMAMRWSFVSGHRFSDAVQRVPSRAPSGAADPGQRLKSHASQGLRSARPRACRDTNPKSLPARERSSPRPELSRPKDLAAQSSQLPVKRKPGWLARLLSVGWDAVTSQRGAAGGEERLVWLWPVSVARTALTSRQQNWRRGRSASQMVQPDDQLLRLNDWPKKER
jgi:hypothetical protein